MSRSAGLLAAALCAGMLTGILAASTSLRASGATDLEGQSADGHPLVERVWSVADRAFVDPDRVRAAIAAARFALVGEIHDNPRHHTLQAHLLGASVEAGRAPAVVLEMLPRDLQPRLDAYLGKADASADGFGTALGWDELGWPDYAIYRPILEVALAASLPVVAGDTPRNERRSVARGGLGILGETRRDVLQLDEPLGETADTGLLDTLFEGHCGMMPRAGLMPLVAVQRLRDATLADAMISAAEEGGDGAVLIAGAGHARTDFGVPRYLRWRQPDASVVAVALVEVAEGETDPTSYAGGTADMPAPYDYLWFTARKDRTDPCAELEKRFENAK
ncbi:ChaN family lipoprotein [Stappia sp.]|uniref:ChaN family lipoprotein n=1 Tax=Stappia sp. TaxID=1870903 RepID=UPI003D0A415A